MGHLAPKLGPRQSLRPGCPQKGPTCTYPFLGVEAPWLLDSDILVSNYKIVYRPFSWNLLDMFVSCKFSCPHELTGLWPNCSIWLLVSNMTCMFNSQPYGIIIPNDYMNLLYDHIFEGLALPLKRALKPATRNSSPAPGTSCGLSFPMSSTSWLDPVQNASWCAPATLKTEGTKIV